MTEKTGNFSVADELPISPVYVQIERRPKEVGSATESV